MCQQTPDVVTGKLGETSIAFAIIEERLLIFPEALMNMHTGTIVAKHRFGHECDGLAVLAGSVLDNIFVEHHIVGGLE